MKNLLPTFPSEQAAERSCIFAELWNILFFRRERKKKKKERAKGGKKREQKTGGNKGNKQEGEFSASRLREQIPGTRSSWRGAHPFVLRSPSEHSGGSRAAPAGTELARGQAALGSGPTEPRCSCYS